MAGRQKCIMDYIFNEEKHRNNLSFTDVITLNDWCRKTNNYVDPRFEFYGFNSLPKQQWELKIPREPKTMFFI